MRVPFRAVTIPSPCDVRRRLGPRHKKSRGEGSEVPRSARSARPFETTAASAHRAPPPELSSEHNHDDRNCQIGRGRAVGRCQNERRHVSDGTTLSSKRLGQPSCDRQRVRHQ